MSVQSEINRVKNNVASAYTAVAAKGGTVPSTQNSANLAAAVNSIPEIPNPLPIGNGGTGATTASAAVGNLIAALGDPSQESSYTDLCIPMCDISNASPYGSKESLSSIMTRINNRSDKVSLANTSYTTYMARAVALVTSAPSSMTNGTIALVYA